METPTEAAPKRRRRRNTEEGVAMLEAPALPLEARLLACPNVRAFCGLPEDTQAAIRTLLRPRAAATSTPETNWP